MKKILRLAVCLLSLGVTPLFAQTTLMQGVRPGLTHQNLTKFDLDFSGGSPADLVKAIEHATGKPLNVIINKEDEGVAIPPLKMNEVDVVQLFTALEVASRKMVQMITPYPIQNYNYMTSYGFTTSDDKNDHAVWCFNVQKPTSPPIVVPKVESVCQYYSLSPYLNRGFTVDDITTAIQTGWKMEGAKSLPELNYHKETMLLIAYGEPKSLETISKVLGALPDQKALQTRNRLDAMSAEVQLLRKDMDFIKNGQNTFLPSGGNATSPAPTNAAPHDTAGK